MPNSAGQVARRRKLITRTVTWALGVTLVSVAAGYWWSRRHDNKPVQVPQTLPTNVNQRLSGYTFTRSDEGRQIFSVHAARTVAFKQGGTTVLEDVFVEVFGRTGARRDVLRTRRCDYNTQSGDLFSSGKVEIELNAGPEGKAMGAGRERRQVLLETSRVYFRGRGSLVVSDEPVRYRIGAVAGSARGMTYATKDGWLELSKDVTAEFTPPESAQLPLRLTASRARYDKERGEVVLWAPVEFSQGNRRVEAGRGVLILNARNRIVQAVLEEGTRAVDFSEKGRLEGSALRIRGDFDPETEQLRTVWAEGDVQVESRREGSISRLEAQQVEVAFAGAHPQPQNGSASGNVKLTIESSRVPGNGRPTQVAPERPRVERKELTSSALRFAFQSAGQSLKQAETVGSGKLVLIPPDPRVGERVITAGQFLMDFDARNRLETLRGISGTRIVFQPGSGAPAGSLAQESSAERLEASFDPATQAVRAVWQAGGFQFREGDRQATAEQASYQAEAETLTLTGRPQLWDLETRTRAERFVLDLRTDTAEGVGKVQSTHLGPAGRGEGGRQSDPTHVLADRVVAERRSQVVHYEGNVRAWHGSDVVESSALDVSRTERRVSSGLRVRSSHLQPAALMPAAASASGAKPEARPVVICADRLEYFDAGRRASYRGNVRLQAEMTTLEADGLDVYFSTAASVEQAELERAVAEGHVSVVQPSRRATGNRAEYFAREGKILLSGGPPTLYDAEKGFITGQRLTFHIHDDTLQADGGDESPTVSKHRIAQ